MLGLHLSSSFPRRYAALPQQHGSWALWLAPYAVGIGVSGAVRPGLVWLTLACLGAFLAVQPLTLLVKIFAGRRSRDDFAAALFWLSAWGLLTGIGCAGLALGGNAAVLLLGLAAVPVLAWQMFLVARHSERGQAGAEIVGAGTLTLAAPAACLVLGHPAADAWRLWGLCWLQAAGAILYIYHRLEQRRRPEPPARQRLSRARGIVAVHLLSLSGVAALGSAGVLPRRTWLPFAFLVAEVVVGSVYLRTAGSRPAAVGLRQVFVTLLFSLLLVLTYRW